MVRVLRGLLAAALLTAAGAAEAADRDRLWAVVGACASAHRLIGASFPCLSVELPGGDQDAGWAVLRPFRRDDLILAPTRRTVGVEDPFLRSAGAPNYFAAAWSARSFLTGPDGEPPARDEVVLVVNSLSARSQDQLHIHIGCLKPGAQRFLAAAAARMPLGRWTRIGPVLPHQVYFGERVREADFAKLNPFRIAAEGFPGADQNPGGLMVATVGARVRGEDDFLILALFEGVRGDVRHSGAEGLLDKRCTSPSPLG